MMKQFNLLCLLLALLLLMGCTTTPKLESVETTSFIEPTQTEVLDTEPVSAAPTEQPSSEHPEPDPAESEGLDALTAETVLLFRQDQQPGKKFNPDQRGELVPVEDIFSWWEEQQTLPRTHYFDAEFASHPALLMLLDYALFHGYSGFSADASLLCLEEFTASQWSKLDLIYRVDYAQISKHVTDSLFGENDGLPSIASVWLVCPDAETMDRFSQGLDAARKIVSEIPEGSDEYDAARFLYEYLRDHVSYDRRGLDYYEGDWSIVYDALIRGSCVCTGYSDALYYLYNLAGIECLTVDGVVEATEVTEAENHQWNVARLYDSWYSFDATWEARSDYRLENSYFAVSKDVLSGYAARSYSLRSASYVPACDRSFFPAEAWNNSPEGALRSYLWLYRFSSVFPRAFLVYAGLLRTTDEPLHVSSGKYAAYDVEYEAFAELCDPFVTPVFFRKSFARNLYRESDGYLEIYSDYTIEPLYRIVEVEPQGKGYKAQLVTSTGQSATATFTVEESEGRYRIASISIT